MDDVSTTTVAETTSLKPTQFCDILDSSWMCSLENEQHSLCIKFCSKNDVTSYKRCVCRHSECSWSQKGHKCLENVPDTSPGNPFSNPNYDLAALRSIMKEINIANHGHIHVKFQLWKLRKTVSAASNCVKNDKPLMKSTSNGEPYVKTFRKQTWYLDSRYGKDKTC